MLYNLNQASAQLGGLSRSKLYMEIAEGRLRVTKIGARTFISRSALRDYITAHEQS